MTEYTQEQLMEWLNQRIMDGYMGEPAVSYSELEQLFKGHKLVPSDAVVLSREQALQCIAGSSNGRASPVGESVLGSIPDPAIILAIEYSEMWLEGRCFVEPSRDKEARELVLNVLRGLLPKTIAQPQPKCKCVCKHFEYACHIYMPSALLRGTCITCGHDKDCHASGGGHA